MLKVKENYRFWVKLTCIYFFIQICVRSYLIFLNPPNFINAVDTYFDGILWDALAWAILSLPLMLLSLVAKDTYHQKFFNSKFNHLVTFFFVLSFSWIGFCELVFWNEFRSRFNFIAVDYLIYTNEVLTNLKESYPVTPIICGVLLFSAALTWLGSRIKFSSYTHPFFLQRKITLSLFGFVIPGLLGFGVAPWLENHDENFRDDQLSRNGMLEFVRAFRSNHIDYKAFYPTLPSEQAERIFANKKVPLSNLSFSLKGRQPNIVFIAVESLGAKFIAGLGGDPNTTPKLNELAGQSLFFQHFYASGTRTVRGLEALNLSVPPTPGYAVVKRPNHKNLYSMGHTFAQNGYDTMFLYGGRGFFDNMNSFFAGNGFQVIDQTDFEKSEVTFSNAWGVCDEDLFNKAQSIIQARSAEAKPFLFFMLTTSNHRPFTYPEGKIDIPSGASRAGAVKYTDYAIGSFIAKARKEKWADNTIFIIVADHSTEGRGQFDLEMTDFHIPLWIFAPKLLKPQVISKLGGQIDLLPSLIHLLGLKDDSPFFGQSLFNTNWKEERAFVGNYQYVGLYRDQVLTTLGPRQTVRNYSYDPIHKKQKRIKKSPFVDEAISYYQKASFMLDSGAYNVDAKSIGGSSL